MNNSQINIDVLNDLIQINNDRIVGYNKAMDELSPEDDDLKKIFASMSRQSSSYKSSLVQEVQFLGETPESGTTTSGKIYRAWMDIKAVFTGHDRQTVLNNCEFGEDAAKKAYKMALDTEGLSPNLRTILLAQQTELIAAHNHIKTLRDAMQKE